MFSPVLGPVFSLIKDFFRDEVFNLDKDCYELNYVPPKIHYVEALSPKWLYLQIGPLRW